MTSPLIGITLGDPGGIGPEIILKAFSSEYSLPKANYVLFGSRFAVEEEKLALGLDIEIPPLNERQKKSLPLLSLYDVESSLKTIKRGAPSMENGEASFSFFQAAVVEANKGTIKALITAPISKHSWALAGIRWSGHTDFLAHLFPHAIMSFWSEKLKVVLFTHHISLKKALTRIKEKALHDFFLLLDETVKKALPQEYSYLVAGLNPHAGEQGLLGSEEEEEIIPAVERAKKEGMKIDGPYPPDVVFRKAFNQPDKIAIALYHDQGLIPFKLISFEKGVNVTLGLPFIRTSPDHGTAFDIAGKGMANPRSIIEAIEFTLCLSPLF